MSKQQKVGESLWSKAIYKFRRDSVGIASLLVVGAYFLIALGVWLAPHRSKS